MIVTLSWSVSQILLSLLCLISYAELPKEVKNTISHRYRALAAMSEHFSKPKDGPETKRIKAGD